MAAERTCEATLISMTLHSTISQKTIKFKQNFLYFLFRFLLLLVFCLLFLHNSFRHLSTLRTVKTVLFLQKIIHDFLPILKFFPAIVPGLSVLAPLLRKVLPPLFTVIQCLSPSTLKEHFRSRHLTSLDHPNLFHTALKSITTVSFF